MFIDFNDACSPINFTADICIIGSGAASLAMLTRLYSTKYKVLVIEAGDENITEQSQQLYDVITPYHPFDGARNGRFRVFGGSTTRWGGQSLPIDKIDFEPREWLPNSGWPISYDTIANYYAEVDNFLDLHSNSYEDDIYALLAKSPMPVTEELKLKFSKWSPTPNLREKYRGKINNSTNVFLLKNASVTNLKLTEDFSAVDTVTIKNINSKVGTVKAKNYILACGGIENARLLLASNLELNTGIGNTYDLVGRFLQDHPNAEVGNLIPTSKNNQAYLNYFYVKKTRFLPRFFFSEIFQASKKILNTNAYIQFQSQDNDAFSIAKEIYRKQIRGELSLSELKLALKLIKELPELLSMAKHYYINNKVFTPKALAKLHIIMETPPLWENCISLSAELDRLGTPKAIIKWKVDEKVHHTLLECTHVLKSYFASSNMGEVVVEKWLYTENWADNIKDAKHHIGTTRMANSKEKGVVDKNCKVFGTDNLYIAGSSVFPTSGHSNPTATIIALSLRLVDHILLTND